MKKTISVLLLTLLLTGCGIKEKDRIYLSFHYGVPPLSNAYINTPMSDYAVEISLEHLQALTSGKEDFILYVGQDENRCPDCKIAGPSLREYIAKSKALIYYLDVSDYEIATAFAESVANDYEFLGTPTILFYQNGNILYDHVGSDRLYSYLQVKNLIEGYTKTNSISYVYPPTDIKALFSTNHQLFFLDYQFEKANELYHSLRDDQKDANFYLIDWRYLNLELQTELISSYNLDLSNGACLNYPHNEGRTNLVFDGNNLEKFQEIIF